MSKVIGFHGMGETPESFWLPYLKVELEKRGHTVTIPQLPNTNDPTLSEQLEYALKTLEFTDQTVLIGHSSGCPLILAILEKIPVVVKQVICVAGYSTPLHVDPENTKNLKDSFDFETIKNRSREFIFINADNDPWGADDRQGRILFDTLGGILIINHEGHMGSDSFNQPYKEFPFLVKLID